MMKRLINDIRRINALNNKHYGYIQLNGHTNENMFNELNEMMTESVVENDLDCYNGWKIRMNIDYKITNAEEELFHLTVSVRDTEDEIYSFWHYFFDRNKAKIVARVEEISGVYENFYIRDFFYNSKVEDAVLGAILTYNIGTTTIWDWSVMTFIPINLEN